MKKVSSSYKSSWSSVEDELLVKAVAKWGPHDWYQIASEMPGRLPRQCRERYKNHVRQGINTAPFSREEDAIILTAQGWCVSPVFPPRACRHSLCFSSLIANGLGSILFPASSRKLTLSELYTWQLGEQVARDF